ncbi:MAG: alpha/beta fold hydrolase [Bacteroidetes bacterium]|nr:alpha/beta fold hydrolase [Bacteroidota bacterium]
MINTLLALTFLILTTNIVFALDPVREYVTKPDKYGIPYTEKRLTTTDNAEINIWIYEPNTPDNDITIIIAGSDAGNMSYHISQAIGLLQKGYRVITFDYRGFGSSSDFEMNLDQLYYDEFATDLRTVIQFVNENYQKTRTGIYAMSMGTLLVFMIADTIEFEFLIAEGVVTDPVIFIGRIENEKDKIILLPESAKTVNAKIKEIEIPMLLFAGTLDTFTTIEDCNELIKKNKNRNLIVFNGNHLQGIGIMQQQYIDHIAVFIDNLKN